jgi:thiamine biosynthesis lipoprotein
MRCASALIVSVLLTPATPGTEHLTPVHLQRYCMGTMFDIVVYHAPAAEARHAVERAMGEIVRLDQVMSHFKSDSDLSRLVRDGRDRLVTVEPSLYEVIEESLAFSRRSAGRFDVTMAPLLRTWREAEAAGRRPSAAEISSARRCVGYEKIELAGSGRIRFHSDCLEIDLGGIGKGYAVDRAMAMLRSLGIRHALINAGSSSIAAIGAPPGQQGWPVRVGGDPPAGTELRLRHGSVSTSKQTPVPMAFEAARPGDIIDPRSGAPIESDVSISVVARSATVSDALSTTLLMLSTAEGKALLGQFPDASAFWVSADGAVRASHRRSRNQQSESR